MALLWLQFFERPDLEEFGHSTDDLLFFVLADPFIKVEIEAPPPTGCEEHLFGMVSVGSVLEMSWIGTHVLTIAELCRIQRSLFWFAVRVINFLKILTLEACYPSRLIGTKQLC